MVLMSKINTAKSICFFTRITNKLENNWKGGGLFAPVREKCGSIVIVVREPEEAITSVRS